MNHSSPYNRAFDSARQPASRDPRWAQERRRQHDRQVGEAMLLLATKPVTLARKTVVVSGTMLLIILGGEWLALRAAFLADWVPLIQWATVAASVAVLIGALVSLLKLRARRETARVFLRANQGRFAQTQYPATESVPSFNDSTADARNIRHAHSA
ncbi:MAG: hypothetical protein ACHP7F_07225 [Actinomycetales bacterium]|nr:hypothetical protein [Leifsonia sp.]